MKYVNLIWARKPRGRVQATRLEMGDSSLMSPAIATRAMRTEIDRVLEDPVKGQKGGRKRHPAPENKRPGQGHERERDQELAADLPDQDRHRRHTPQMDLAAEESPRAPRENDVPPKLQALGVRVDQHRLPRGVQPGVGTDEDAKEGKSDRQGQHQRLRDADPAIPGFFYAG